MQLVRARQVPVPASHMRAANGVPGRERADAPTGRPAYMGWVGAPRTGSTRRQDPLTQSTRTTMSLPPTPSSTEAFVRPWGTADGPRSASSAGPDSPTRLRTSSESGPSSPPRAYRSHPGCSLCTLVNYPARPDGLGLAREVLRDDRVIVYEAEERARAASGGHLVVVLNDHANSVYELVSISTRPTTSLTRSGTSRRAPAFSHPSTRVVPAPRLVFAAQHTDRVHYPIQYVCFRSIALNTLTRQTEDSYFPQGHLHAHILSGPLDKASFWRRNGPYGPMSWYELEDLIAEIRYVSQATVDRRLTCQ